MGGEDSMVQHKIDARAWSQGGELFEELQGLEEKMAGAIGPLALELQPDAAVPGEPKAVLSDRRPEQVAAELLQARAVFCRHGHDSSLIDRTLLEPAIGVEGRGVRA
jgi:hypothetical protein